MLLILWSSSVPFVCSVRTSVGLFMVVWASALTRGDRTQVFGPRHFPPVGYFTRPLQGRRTWRVFKELYTSFRKDLEHRTIPIKSKGCSYLGSRWVFGSLGSAFIFVCEDLLTILVYSHLANVVQKVNLSEDIVLILWIIFLKCFFFTLEIISFNNFSCWGLYSSWCISCLQSFNCYCGVSGVKWFFLCLRVLFSLSQLLQHHTYCSGIQEGNSAESQCCAQVCISHTASSAPTTMPVLTCRLINTLKWCFLSLDQNLASYP